MKNNVNQNPMIIRFFAEHPLFAEEFLVGFIASRIRPTVVMTTQRLWMYDKERCEYVTLTISNIAQMTVSRGWLSCAATVRFKDGLERTFENLEDAPSSSAIARAIERCSSPEKVALPRRGGCLTAFLTFNLLMVILSFGFLKYGDRVGLAVTLSGAVGIIAAFNWQRWGVYLIYVSSLLAMLADLSHGDGRRLLALLPLAILAGLLQPVWKWFK